MAATLTKHGATKSGPQHRKYRRNPDAVSREEARRQAILTGLAAGLVDVEIAAEADCSRSYITKEIHKMLAEHRLSNRAHLVAWAYRSGVLKLDS